MDDEEDQNGLPYRVEYARRSKALCKGCKTKIEKDLVRLGVIIPSAFYDGPIIRWYHLTCFFISQRPRRVEDIAHIESLRFEDQLEVEKRVEAGISPVFSKTKRKRGSDKDSSTSFGDFYMEYAKSGRTLCEGCDQKIIKNEIRVRKKDFQSDIAKKYGGRDLWYHSDCFVKLRSELMYFAGGDEMNGYDSLIEDDKKRVKLEMPPMEEDGIPLKVKKFKKSVIGIEENKEFMQQMQIIYMYKDNIRRLLKTTEMEALLQYNNQKVPVGKERLSERISDYMTFGALLPCSDCKNGYFVLHKSGYICQGDKSKWAKCGKITRDPKRDLFLIPDDLRKKYPFLADCRPTVGKRIFRYNPDTDDESDTGVHHETKIERKAPPLSNMEFVFCGISTEEKNSLKVKIVQMGGKVSTKIHRHTMAVISTTEKVNKMVAQISKARTENVHVVSINFVDKAEKCENIFSLVNEESLCDWGSDPLLRVLPNSKSKKSKSGLLGFSMPGPSSAKIFTGGKFAVDPESKLEHVARVYSEGKAVYSTVLGLTDVQSKKNSYYKLQLLVSNSSTGYWVFRSWGRIGTKIGGKRVVSVRHLYSAKKEFERLYLRETGNEWSLDKFVKVPGKLYPIDVDHGSEQVIPDFNNIDVPSKLDKAVQKLIKLIFDVNRINQAMMEYELDLEKMPLGRLSRKQLISAYSILGELQMLIDNNENYKTKYIDASNRFYTCIPQSFGANDPPIINKMEMVKQKIEMLDNLMNMEITYSLINKKPLNNFEKSNPVDLQYEKLNTEIKLLSKTSDEYKLIETYIRNTHSQVHNQYELKVLEIFTIKRNDEEQRYDKYRNFHNRHLLWHGSRLTNYPGILSQGLRIAPPEAPVSGYTYGKGIYFADMVSKSANYCNITSHNGVGLVLLCEVALGNMFECTGRKYIEKLPKGMHSTKAVGQIQPDPKSEEVLEGVHIPVGKAVRAEQHEQLTLLHNEYIVYKEDQVNIKYLLKLCFKYK